MDRELEEKLMEAAKQGREQSYSPYSKFAVGAALLCKDGTIFTGCNIENVSYGATMCAERVAIFKAISNGYREFEMIAVYSELEDYTYPCGMCLQVMQEFMPEGIVLLENKKEMNRFLVRELMPTKFEF